MTKKNIKKHGCYPLWIRWPAVCLAVTLLGMAVSETGWTAVLPGDSSHRITAAALNLPVAIGKVESFHQGTNGKTLFYIEDAHSSLEAQENIARIIGHLVKKNGVKTVFEEGYDGPVPTEWFREAIPDSVKRKKAAWYLLDHLRLGGAEYAHILSWRHVKKVGSLKLEVRSKKTKKDDGLFSVARGSSREDVGLLTTTTDSQRMLHGSEFSSNFQLQTSNSLFRPDFKLIGADDENLHRRNIQLYRETAEVSAQTAADLQMLKNELNHLALTEFPKSFRTWMRLSDRFHSGTLGLPDYLLRTQEVLTASGEHFPESLLPQITLLLSALKINEAPDISARKLYREIEILERWIVENYLDGGGRHILDYLKKIRSLEALNSLTLSSPEFETLLASMPEIGISSGLLTRQIGDFIFLKTKRPIVFSCSWEKNMALAREYYRTVAARDRVLAKKLSDFYAQQHERKAVLVFGGFHKRAILQMLQEEGWSYAVITPTIHEISPRHESYYREIMTHGRMRGESISAPKQWVTQERLFNLVKTPAAMNRYLVSNLPRKLARGLISKESHPIAIEAAPSGRSEVRGTHFKKQKDLKDFLMQTVERMSPENLVQNIYRVATHPEFETDHASFLLDVINHESARVYIGYGPHGSLILPSEYPVTTGQFGPWKTRNRHVIELIKKMESVFTGLMEKFGVSFKTIRLWIRKLSFLHVEMPVDESGAEARALFFRGHFKMTSPMGGALDKPIARFAIKPPYAYEEHYASLIKNGLITPLEFEQGLYADLLEAVKFLAAGGIPPEAPLSLEEFSHLPRIQAFFSRYLKTSTDGVSADTSFGELIRVMPEQLTETASKAPDNPKEGDGGVRSEVRSLPGAEELAVESAALFLKQKKWRLPGDTLVYPAAGIDAATVMAFVRARPEIKRVILIDPDYNHSGYGNDYRNDLLRGLIQNKADFETREAEKISSGDFDSISRTLRSEFFVHPPIWKLWENSRSIQLEMAAQDYLKWNPRGEALPQGAALTVVKNPGDAGWLSRRDLSGNAFYQKVFHETALFGVIYEGRAFLPDARTLEENSLELMRAGQQGEALWQRDEGDEPLSMPADSYWLLRKNKFESGRDFIAHLARLDYDAIQEKHFSRYLQEVVKVLNHGKPSFFQRFHTYYWFLDAVFAGVLLFVDVVHALIQLALAVTPLFMKSVRKGLIRALKDRSFQMDARDFHHRHTPAVKERMIRWLLSRVTDGEDEMRQVSMRALLAAGVDTPALLEGLSLLRDDFEPLLNQRNLELIDRSKLESPAVIREALYQDYTARQISRSEMRNNERTEPPASEDPQPEVFNAILETSYRLTFPVKVLQEWIAGRTEFFAEPLKSQSVLRLHLDRGLWADKAARFIQSAADAASRRRYTLEVYPQVFPVKILPRGRILIGQDLQKAAAFITPGSVILTRVNQDTLDIHFSEKKRSEVRGSLYDPKRNVGLILNGMDHLKHQQSESEWVKKRERRMMGDVLTQQGIKLEDYTTLVYPASGLREMFLLERLRKNLFPRLAHFYLNDMTYHERFAVYETMAGRKVSAGEHIMKQFEAAFPQSGDFSPKLKIYDADYQKEQFDFSADSGRRIWIDKGPGRDAELRHDDEFYLSTLRRGIVRPGDLILAVPFVRTDHARYWHQKIAEGVYVPDYDDWRWDVFIVTEEDFTAVGLPVPARSEVRRAEKNSLNLDSLRNLTGRYRVVMDIAAFSALSAEEQEGFYKLFEAYQPSEQVKFIFNAVGDESMRMPNALKVFDRRYSNVRVVSMPADKLSFNDEGRRVISVSREGVPSVYNRFVEDKKPSQGFLKVRYGFGGSKAGLLAAALLLYETKEPETWNLSTGGFLTEIPETFKNVIAEFLAGYIAIGTSA